MAGSVTKNQLWPGNEGSTVERNPTLELARTLIARRLGIFRGTGALVAGVLAFIAGSSSSHVGRSRRGSVGLAGERAGVGSAAAAAVTAALATPAAGAAEAAAIGIVKIDKGRHLSMGVLQHGAVVVT